MVKKIKRYFVFEDLGYEGLGDYIGAFDTLDEIRKRLTLRRSRDIDFPKRRIYDPEHHYNKGTDEMIYPIDFLWIWDAQEEDALDEGDVKLNEYREKKS